MFTEVRAATLGGLGSLGWVPDIHADSLPTGGGGSGNGIDWNQVIQSGFQFGTTFLNNKYASDAARYAGGYYPQGQGGTSSSYPSTGQTPVTTTTGTNAPFSLDRALQGALSFVQKNIVLVGGGLLFWVALKRDPNKNRR